MSMRAGGRDRPPLPVGDDGGETVGSLFCVAARKRILSRLHAEKLALCDLLEEMADSLPQSLDRERCLAVSARLEPLLRDVHAYEERVLFPALIRLHDNARQADELVARLKAEHIEDADFAAELAEGLRRIGQGLEQSLNVDALGYMLRGFFASLRRHIANEREALAPLFEAGT